MAQAETVTVEIKNWSQYNPRSDIKQPSWFRLSHSITEDQDFDHFTHEEFKVWIHLLCLASKKNSGKATLRYDHAKRICRLSRRGIDSAIKKLQELGAVTVHVTRTSRERNVRDTHAFATNATNATNERDAPTFDFEPIWKSYPRKTDRADALERFSRLIKSAADFAALQRAVGHYAAHHAAQKTEMRFIRHFTTFLGTEKKQRWREWIDGIPEGERDGVASNGGAGRDYGFKDQFAIT